MKMGKQSISGREITREKKQHLPEGAEEGEVSSGRRVREQRGDAASHTDGLASLKSGKP